MSGASIAAMAAVIAEEERRRREEEEDAERKRCTCRKHAWDPNCPVHGR